MIPKQPLALLLVVFGLWAWGVRGEEASLADARIRLESPAFPLVAGTHGIWTLEWPDWPARKGDPYLYATGLPYSIGDERSSVELRLRVDPRDSVTQGTTREGDANGWFEAGNSSDWRTITQLTPRVSSRVEYEVRRADSGTELWAQLHINGTLDGDIIEGASVAEGLCNLLAFLAAAPL